MHPITWRWTALQSTCFIIKAMIQTNSSIRPAAEQIISSYKTAADEKLQNWLLAVLYVRKLISVQNIDINMCFRN